MEEAVPAGQGTMAAVLGMELEKVEEVCRQASQEGVVEVANINTPGQIVISGSREGVFAAMNAFRKNGARKVVPLAVSGPFHSPLMRTVAEVFDGDLNQATFRDPEIPVVSNVGAVVVKTGESARALLSRQIYSRVEWEQSMRRLLSLGVSSFVEVGPGRVLTGLMKKIDKRAGVHYVEDGPTLEKLIQQERKE
jgi:[acyl-carrier-protein] S-malonyltransferase